jgi:flagellar basal body P-ring formation protein FlgA
VLNRRIGAGDVIAAQDIAWMDMRQSRVDGDTVIGENQLVGRTPRRQAPANTPLRQRDIQAPQVVARNALVLMTLESRRMTLTAQGRALQEGAVGDVIRVMNTQSNRTIEARVTGINAVAVAIAPRPVAVN